MDSFSATFRAWDEILPLVEFPMSQDFGNLSRSQFRRLGGKKFKQ
jgi:hypothetical protein